MTSAPETLRFPRHDFVPNSPNFPVLIYRSVIVGRGKDLPAALEALFRSHSWPPQWRASIYPFHHYHSKAHEALGVARGSGRLMLGGPGGEEVKVSGGDVLVLPAGTGHQRLASSEDFLVVGAYPPGQENWDLCREAPTPEALARIAALPAPETDPVGGTLGELWRKGGE